MFFLKWGQFGGNKLGRTCTFMGTSFKLIVYWGGGYMHTWYLSPTPKKIHWKKFIQDMFYIKCSNIKQTPNTKYTIQNAK